MSSCFSLFLLNPPIHHHKPLPLSSSSSLSHSLTFNSHVCFSSSSSSSSAHPNGEETRWLREEQRWLREEQRWLREEQRWARERDSLLREISDLRLQVQALEHRLSVQGGASAPETIASIAGLLQVLKEKSLIAETGSSTSSVALVEEEEKEKSEKKEEEEMGVEKVDRVLEGEGQRVLEKKRGDLRKGSEGEEVRALQEALQKLGFYSGEEDIEFSSFSSGTERAVKTWQATLGAPEDGIMTEELLERLYVEQKIQTIKDSPTDASEDGANGAAISSVTEISKIQQKVVKEDGIAEVDVSKHRVFLLGENRWEEPSRLVGNNKQASESQTKASTKQCLTCRGEGRLMCTECDGTGEPNIEPQFLEWVDEGAKCPYCEGLGHIMCDVCEGKGNTAV